MARRTAEEAALYERLFGEDSSEDEEEQVLRARVATADALPIDGIWQNESLVPDMQGRDVEVTDEPTAGGGASAVSRGYLPPDGTVYSRPRSCFLRTHWDGRQNAFIRTDPSDNRRNGPAPSGYVWDPELPGLRRTREQTDADEEALAARNNAASERGTGRASIDTSWFGPNVPDGSLNEYSIYVGAMGQHAPLRWMGFLQGALEKICNHEGSAAAMGQERGDKKRLIHYQIVLRLVCQSGQSTHEKIRLFLRKHLGILPGGNVKVKIGVTQFGVNQSWLYMLGYVQKDSAQTHYKFWSMNVDPADCERGKAEYKSVSVRNRTQYLTPLTLTRARRAAD